MPVQLDSPEDEEEQEDPGEHFVRTSVGVITGYY